MDLNIFRRVEWLWRQHHPLHGDAETLLSQIKVIRQTVEEQSDKVAASGSGAHIHLERSFPQEITTKAAVIWGATNPVHPPFEFTFTPPSAEVTIPKPDYYDFEVKFALAAPYADGGTVTLTRTRDSGELVVWPEPSDADVWVASRGRVFDGVAKAIDCLTGDVFKVYVAHNSGSPVDLEWATLTAELVHGGTGVDEPHLGWEEAISFDPTAVGLVVSNTAAWNAGEIREQDGVKFDPATGLWVLVYSGLTSAGFAELGIATSTDQVIWTEGSNPISGGTESEDGYLAKDIHGNVWRDSAGRAYLYAEEKVAGVERGINLFRSGADVLTGWTFHSRVIDKGASGGGWDSGDSQSPVVIHDGTQFVMLFEGRTTSTNGSIGHATSSDGLTWVVDATEVLTPGAGGTWNDGAIVPDDVIKIGDRWILLTHGHDGTDWGVGRYETTDAPADWDENSFTEMAGNPIETYGPTGGATITCWGNDPRYVTYLVDGNQAIEKRKVAT